jgi:putative transport protein
VHPDRFVILGQLGTFTIPALLKTVLFSLFAPVLGVAVPYAVGNVVLTVLGPIIVACTFVA